MSVDEKNADGEAVPRSLRKPTDEIEISSIVPVRKKSKQKPDGGKYMPEWFARPYPWEWDRYAVGFKNVVKLERRFMKLEVKTDVYIEDFQQKKYDKFEALGGQHWDKTRKYSTDKGRHCLFPKWDQKLKHFMKMSDAEKMRTLLNRLVWLDSLHYQLCHDINRLWLSDHDGKSCRYYRESPRTGRALPDISKYIHDDVTPWYLMKSQKAVDTNVGKRKVHKNECSFCLVDRMVFELQNKVARLEVSLYRLPNTPYNPPGMNKAELLWNENRLHYSDFWDSSSDSSDDSSDTGGDQTNSADSDDGKKSASREVDSDKTNSADSDDDKKNDTVSVLSGCNSP